MHANPSFMKSIQEAWRHNSRHLWWTSLSMKTLALMLPLPKKTPQQKKGVVVFISSFPQTIKNQRIAHRVKIFDAKVLLHPLICCNQSLCLLKICDMFWCLQKSQTLNDILLHSFKGHHNVTPFCSVQLSPLASSIFRSLYQELTEFLFRKCSFVRYPVEILKYRVCVESLLCCYDIIPSGLKTLFYDLLNVQNVHTLLAIPQVEYWSWA